VPSICDGVTQQGEVTASCLHDSLLDIDKPMLIQKYGPDAVLKFFTCYYSLAIT